eukprot:scaffold69268_cov75-Phaeocystis_antarctica.AAC.8
MRKSGTSANCAGPKKPRKRAVALKTLAAVVPMMINWCERSDRCAHANEPDAPRGTTVQSPR